MDKDRSERRRASRAPIFGVLTFLVAIPLAPSALAALELNDIKRMSIEELMEVEVYTASRRLEPTRDVPSAIYVVTQDAIRRAHVTSVPEALRLVPGVQVARVDANKWAVSMRGFNSREANKLLVLIDGRTVYDQLFSGVLWESQDVMLENVERIEVIRGPGGSLWGANAFNGVINIITKHARDTQGGLATALLGDEEEYTGSLRYGIASDRHAARIYVKGYERDRGYSTVAPPHDAARMFRSGFRWDGTLTDRDEVRVSGDFFDAKTGIREDPTLVQDVEHEGWNVLASWGHRLAEENQLRVQVYYDNVVFESFGFDQERTTYDIEVQQSWRWFDRHDVVWGGGYRRLHDETLTAFPGLIDVLPARRRDEVKTVFVQDTIDVLRDELRLTLGAKYEETDYAKSDWLPNVRVAWMPDDSQTWWAAASEATRTPSRLESDLTFFGFIRPGEDFEAEHVRAFELGHRQILSRIVGYDFAAFYNHYTDLRASEAAGRTLNRMRGSTYGAELSVRIEPTDRIQVEVAYSFLKMDLRLDRESTGDRGQPRYIEGLSPRQQASVRTAMDLGTSLEFDATVRYVDQLPSLGYSDYTELDLGLTWHAMDRLALSLVGQNLLHEHHPEQDFAFSASGMPTEVERRFHVKASFFY